MEEIILFCRKCNQDQPVTIQVKANNHVAYCSVCGSYIKNIPHSTEDSQFYFGKYKGTKIKDCKDLQYMKWILANVKLTEKIRDDISYRISLLEYELK